MKRNTLVFTAAASILYLTFNSFTTAPSRIGHVAVSGCGGGSCHGSSSAATVVGINLSKDGIPVTNGKYTPGAKYKITLTGTNSSYSRWGFQVSATNSSNAMAGVFSNNPDSTLISTTGGLKVVEHNNAILRPNGMSVSFDWTAPAAGTGNVKLSAAVNAVNYNQNSAGDAFNTIQITLSEASTSVANTSIIAASIYPNPASNTLQIQSPLTEQQYVIQIFDVRGQLLLQQNMSAHEKQVNISTLGAGTYMLKVSAGNSTGISTFIKQ